jgi:DNA-binding transcriptional LysR family regulator
MDTQLLEDALLLLEEKNLSAAATRRNMTQPAFSRRIRALEDWIGRDLLVRGANRVEISPALFECEMQIRAMLAHLQQLRGQLKNAEQAGRPLVFATQHSLSVSIFPEILRKLGQVNPQAWARLRTQNQTDAMAMFLRHEADIVITYLPRDVPETPFDDSVIKHIWRRDALVPVIGGHLRYGLREDMTLRSGTPILRYPEGSQFARIVELGERSANLRIEGKVAVETAFSVGVAKLILGGVGAGWVPHSLIQDEIRSGDAVFLSHEYGRIPLDIAVYVHRSNKHAVETLQQLVDLLSTGH